MATPTRRSLANCRRVLAKRLNSLTLVTTDSNAADTTSVVSTQLVLALNDQNRYRNHWLYPYDGNYAGLTRKVGDSALQPSTGTLKVAQGWAGAMPTATVIELHKRLPPTSMDDYTGLDECLNMALRELWVLDRLSVTAVTGQASYDLGTLFTGLADWLDPQSVVEFYGPQVAAGLNIIPWGGFAAIQDAESIQLQVSPGLTSGQATTLEITRPANTYIKLGGVTWTDNQDGFTADTDECLFRPEVLANVALIYAYQAIADNAEGTQRADYAARAQAQRMRVNALKLRQLPHPAQRASHSPVAPYVMGGDTKSWWT